MGIIRNEKVDEYAKEATRMQPEKGLRIPAKDICAGFKQAQGEATQRTVSDRNNFCGTKYFAEFHKASTTQPWFAGRPEGRGFTTMVNRLRVNHYNLGELLARKGYIADSRCQYGAESETIDHVAFGFSHYESAREEFLEQLQSINIKRSSNPSAWR